jgi:hypothetical protein
MPPLIALMIALIALIALMGSLMPLCIQVTVVCPGSGSAKRAENMLKPLWLW